MSHNLSCRQVLLAGFLFSKIEKKKIRNLFLCLSVVALLTCLTLFSCSLNNTSVEPGTDSIILSHEGRESIISLSELLQFDSLTRQVTPIPKDDEPPVSREVEGILLDDVLQHYLGLSQQDVGGIRLIAGDGYAVEVSAEILNAKPVILAYKIDGQALEPWEEPLRAVIPNEYAMYWVKNLEKIELVKSRQIKVTETIVMLESLIDALPSQEYEYYGQGDRVVNIDDVLADVSGKMWPGTVLVKGVDGLQKTEQADVFERAQLKYTGADSLLFFSEQIPRGMWIKQVLFFKYGNLAYFSTQGGLKSGEAQFIEGNECITLNSIINACGMPEDDHYILESANGEKMEIDKKSISSVYVYLNQKGIPEIYFESIPEDNLLSDLLYIRKAK